ncbi:hypothetical protein QR680_018035 [Steinernema hermaphroditum]|uniref:Uncharacterized protein n=1 Tax=Steinernema hermaphroditum TaxID=289476 RepID=A0AA39HGP4_9BILA|nr:hypothetical protein QR680_018035 [Steinernema hermaphroditum]
MSQTEDDEIVVVAEHRNPEREVRGTTVDISDDDDIEVIDNPEAGARIRVAQLRDGLNLARHFGSEDDSEVEFVQEGPSSKETQEQILTRRKKRTFSQSFGRASASNARPAKFSSSMNMSSANMNPVLREFLKPRCELSESPIDWFENGPQDKPSKTADDEAILMACSAKVKMSKTKNPLECDGDPNSAAMWMPRSVSRPQIPRASLRGRH